MEIRFKFAANKARIAVHWLAGEHGSIDLHAALKACYFADKSHLNEHHRPIFGASYRAMRFGPVPLEIYEMMKGEPYWLAELRLDAFPWRLEGRRLVCTDNRGADLGELSESAAEHLRAGAARSLAMTFDERTAATHGPDWQAANLGMMRYEDMIDDTTPDKPEIVAYLRANGRYMRL